VTAVSSSYALTLVARFLAGVSAGLAWGIIAGHARRMVPGHPQGRALALAMTGTPLALSLSLPDVPGQASDRRVSVKVVFLTPGIRPVLFVICAWMLAHNVLYTYVAPFVTRAGLGGRVDLVLLVFGVSALFGIWLVGRLVDRWLRVTVIASLLAFALVAVALLAGGTIPAVVYLAVALWGLAFGGAATLLGTAGADAAGEGVDTAQAMNTTAWNLAITGGGVGLLLDRFGAGSFPLAVLLLLLPALAVARSARTDGFRPGPRAASLR